MTHRIVIVGAGYAGLGAATRLARRTRGRDVRIELLNATPSFVERVRLHQTAADTGRAERPLGGMLAGTGVALRVGRATAIDPTARTVRVEPGADMSYDTLVYALGSFTAVDQVSGVAEHAYTLDGDSPRQLAGALPGIASGRGTLAVCGGGLTGVEAATEFAEAYPGLRVTLVTRGGIGAGLSPQAGAHIRQVFDRLGIDLLESTEVRAVTATGVRLADGREITTAATLWCGSFAVPALAADAGLDTDPTGRIRVDETMRSVSHPDVYAVGDAAAIPLPWGAQRMSCQAGAPAGGYAADAIVTRLSGGEPAGYRFRYLLQCVSLGRSDGVIQLVHADDSPARVLATGRSAARIKEIVCRGAAWISANGRLSNSALYPRPIGSLARRPDPAPADAA